jgi:hypothetical protein
MDEWHAMDIVGEAFRRRHTAYVTPEGSAWLASASPFPRSVQALWSARPSSPGVLPCGTAFDAVDLSPPFARVVLEQLWGSGPGSGPVAVHRGRVLLLVAPGTAQRLPALLAWEEWSAAVPPMLCHGSGDAVTLPPPCAQDPVAPMKARDPGPGPGGPDGVRAAPSHWVVAPDTLRPWLPGADVLLWACVRAARTAAAPAAPPLVSAPGTA